MHPRESITQHQAYQALCQNMREYTGRSGMIWHCFANKTEAEGLLSWLKQQANLLPLEINKANVKEEKLPEQNETDLVNRWFVVRLSAEQRQAILASAVSRQPAINSIPQWTAEDKALIQVNNKNKTGLLVAAYTENQNDFMTLVAKAAAEAINAALVKQDNDGRTALHVAALYQSESALMALVAKASAEAINAALVKQANDGWTAIHSAARHQSGPAFIALMSKASPAAVAQAVALEPADIMTSLFTYQSPAAIAAVLSKLIVHSNQALVNLPLLSVPKVVGYLLHEKSWHDSKALIEYCFAALGKELAPALIDAWLEGYTFVPEVSAILQQYLAASGSNLTSKEKDWLAYQTKLEVHKQKVQLADGSFLDLDPLSSPALIDVLFKKGLASWQDVRILRERQTTLPALKEALDKLLQLRLVAHAPVVEVPCLAATSSDASVCEQLMGDVRQDKVLLKIIKPEAWQEFIDQLKNYNNRPALRKKIDKAKATHKFEHMTGKLVDYKYDPSLSANKVRSFTKKTSTTLIAKDLSTAVFGEHHSSQLLVGILFDRDRCTLKALLAHDSGTYNREWVGEKEKVQDYAQTIQAINYTDLNSFTYRVNTNAHRTNEVLAGLTRESMLAIVIARDTPEARKIARERRKEITNLFQKTLPIVFLDKVTRTFKPYSDEAMQADEGGLNVYHEAAAKNILLHLQSKIKQKDHWQVFSLFACFQPKLMPKTAKLILEKIKQAEQAASAGQPVWVKTESEVKQLLENVITDSSIFRYRDTEDFYKQAYQEMK